MKREREREREEEKRQETPMKRIITSFSLVTFRSFITHTDHLYTGDKTTSSICSVTSRQYE